MKNNPSKKSQISFTPTEVGVLIEDLRSRFNVVAEGQEGLTETVGNLNDKVESLEKKIDNLGIKTEAVWNNQGRTMERITGMDLRLASLESRKP